MQDVDLYFCNFLVLSLVLLPLHALLRRDAWQRALLALAGAYMLYLVAPRLIVFYLLFWALVWLVQSVLHRLPEEGRTRPVAFWGGVVVILSPMVLWKLFPEAFARETSVALHGFLWTWVRPVGRIDALRDVIVPIGLSFNTFRGIDLLIQAHLGTERRLTLPQTLAFGFFAPVLIIGPIIRYSEFARRDPEPLSRSIGLGLERIVIGLIKVYVLALPLAFSQQQLLDYDPATCSRLRAVLCLFLFAWYFYFNFAGFSDIAIGCGRLYGFRLPENFNFPYLQSNLQKFWANWHMTLTRFAQRNVFVPLGGFRRNTQTLAVVATIMLIALWHDLSLALIVFGLWHALGLWLTRRFAQTEPATTRPGLGLRRVLGTAGTFAFVAVSIPLVIMSLSDVASLYQSLLLGEG